MSAGSWCSSEEDEEEADAGGETIVGGSTDGGGRMMNWCPWAVMKCWALGEESSGSFVRCRRGADELELLGLSAACGELVDAYENARVAEPRA